jgi:hypothetical protein
MVPTIGNKVVIFGGIKNISETAKRKVENTIATIGPLFKKRWKKAPRKMNSSDEN